MTSAKALKPLLMGAVPERDGEALYLNPATRLLTHMLILGSPGSGKSKFLEHLIRQDIASTHGLCLLDIHGTLYQDVKRWCAYKYHLSRNVVLLDPSNGEYIHGFNPFRPRPGIDIDVQVAGMVQALLRIWGAENSNETPTLDRMLRLLFTAMIVRGIPIHEAYRLINFDEHDFRSDVVASLGDAPIVQSAWQQILNLRRAGEWRAEVLSTENRLFRLASSQTIRRFMGSMDDSSNINCLDLMNRGGVLLVNLKESRSLSEENAKAFAALLVNDLFKSAIMFRDRDTLGSDPIPFFLYIDEWQNIITPDIKKILAQARKFGLLLVLANQDLSQLRDAFSPEFVDTLMTCCQVKACFGGLNESDARRMAREMLVGQIDLNETKFELKTTKIRPIYDRDKVFGDATFTGAANSFMYDDVGDQVMGPFSALRTGKVKNKGEGKSISDVPIYRPTEYQEVSSVKEFSVEEQFLRWTDRFREQRQRHCFVKVLGTPAQAIEVPVVETPFVYQTTISEYERDLAAKNRAVPVSQLEERRTTDQAEPGDSDDDLDDDLF